jgi:HEPN domain-containing protein
MVESKVEVLLKVSDVNLARAEKRFEAEEYDSAVFHASMAVESAANAMILELGGGEAKDHRAISGLASVLRKVKPELLRDDKYVQLIDKGREIQREVVYARYPLKVAGKWVTPMEYCTREKTMVVIDNAKFVVNGIKTYLKRTTQKNN